MSYENLPIEYSRVEALNGYVLSDKGYTYYSKRYNRWLDLEPLMFSDGASGFIDLGSGGFFSRIFAWIRNRIHGMDGNLKSGWFFVHDQICNTGLWRDGSKIDNWSASTIAADIVWKAGYRLLSVPIWWAVYLFGGGEARKNGMRRLK